MILRQQSSQPRICFQPPIPTLPPLEFPPYASPGDLASTRNNTSPAHLHFPSHILYTASLRQHLIERATPSTTRYAIESIFCKLDFFRRAWHPPAYPRRQVINNSTDRSLDIQSQCRTYRSMAPLSEHCQISAILFSRPRRHNLVRLQPNLRSAFTANSLPYRYRTHSETQARTNESSCKTWTGRNLKRYKARKPRTF